MQRTTMIAIAAAMGLGLGVGASFLAARSPADLDAPDPVASVSPDAKPSLHSSDQTSPQQQESVEPEGDRADRQEVNSSPEPVALKFDAQATSCPKDGGGGPLIGLYMTDAHLVYVCQGGTGRDDWRQLDYYAVKRTQPDEWIRLRAFVTSGPGFYAENGAYRYEIDPTSLTVLEGENVLSQEPVLRCKGNCS